MVLTNVIADLICSSFSTIKSNLLISSFSPFPPRTITISSTHFCISIYTLAHFHSAPMTTLLLQDDVTGQLLSLVLCSVFIEFSSMVGMAWFFTGVLPKKQTT